MPAVNEKVKKESKKVIKLAKEIIKEGERRVPQGGAELYNEHQESIFDTDLSSAADDYTKACKEHKLWGEKEKSTSKALIEEMKRMKLTSLRVGTDKVIKYKFVDSKEVVTLKDYKPAKRRRSRNF
jgi:hypothetical protein